MPRHLSFILTTMAMAAVDAFHIAQPVRWSQLSSSRCRSCSSSNAHLIQPTVPMTTMSSSSTMSPTPSRTTAMPLRNAIFGLNASANDNNNGSKNNNKNSNHREGNDAASYQEEKTTTTTTTSSSSSSSSSAVSIGDVVQSLHGGKYQFNNNHQYSLAGSSTMGQQFAASLYSSDNSNSNNNNSYTPEEEEEEGLGSGKEEPLPKWVRRLKDPKYHNIGNKLSITETLRFDNTDTINTISIANEERSWEKYHVFLLRFKGDNDDDDDDDDDSGGEDYDAVVPPSKLFRISPTFGHLAPRGGASNVCDESKPYSDSACITVEWIGDGNDNYNGTGNDNTGSGDNDIGRLLLVVGTEADTWRYMLQTPTTPP